MYKLDRTCIPFLFTIIVYYSLLKYFNARKLKWPANKYNKNNKKPTIIILYYVQLYV